MNNQSKQSLSSLSIEEKTKILNEFNNNQRENPGFKTLQQLFEEQVAQTPDYTALVSGSRREIPSASGKAVGKDENIHITYGQLNRQANRLAHLLRKKGVQPNSIVPIMAERSIEMIVAIFAVLKAGGAYLPIDPNYPGERIRFMLENSNCNLLLTQQKFNKIKNFDGRIIDIQDQEPDIYHDGNPKTINTRGNLIYTIYTSGSTGKPKGVMVTIDGFVNLLYWFNTEFEIDASDHFLLIAPISFDLAQKNLFSPLLKGGTLFLSTPGLPDYPELSETISKQHITVLNCAPSVFYPLMDFNNNDDFYRLKSLRYLFLGGESIRGERLAPWYLSKNCRCQLVNTYGPTECTDIASSYRVSSEEILEKANIPIGKSIYNVSLFVLDRSHQVIPIGISGELCIGGVGVSWGYMNNPELTAEKFIQPQIYTDIHRFVQERHPPHSPTPPLSHPPLYRTGDLARWQPDGNIEFLGRVDFQVKVRGNRIELGEIENHLITHPEIKEALINAEANDSGENYLSAYIVFKKQHGTKKTIAQQISELKENLAKQLPDYMIPSYFVPLETIPLTPSGKADRKALPNPRLINLEPEEYIPPRNKIEKQFVEIWSEVLGRKYSQIGIDDNFFHLGGHSLKVTIAISRIHQTFNVKLTLADIFKIPTIRGLAAAIRKTMPEGDRFISIKKAEKREYYRLSSAQKRLFILNQMELDSTGYNTPTIYRLEEEPDLKSLEEAFNKLIRRHESFRTSFITVNDEPVQTIHDEVEFEIEYLSPEIYEKHKGSIREFPQQEEQFIKSFSRPFDFSKAPLLRAGLFKTGDNQTLLAVDMHHIISDGTSMEIFRKELADYYDNKELPLLTIQYKEYAQWQLKENSREKLKSREAYWIREFAGEIPVLNLPTDFPRPMAQSYAGNTLHFTLLKEECDALYRLVKAEQATLFMVLFAVCNVLLAKLSGQEDIILGTPVAGRLHVDLEPIIGMFVNTLSLKTNPNNEMTFKHLLSQVKLKTLGAFENQEYQFEDLVEVLNITRDAGRNPLFDVMFVLQNMEEKGSENSTLEMKRYKYFSDTSKFDLTLYAEETSAGLSFDLEYCTKLFNQETIQRYILDFKKIISQVTAGPTAKIAAIEIISNEEKRKILFDFNDSARDYPGLKLFMNCFGDRQRKRRIMHPWWAGTKPMKNTKKNIICPLCPICLNISYKELNEKSNRLAQFLVQKGVGPGMIVAVMMERSVEMIIGILSILKSGGAYMPIDPETPADRLDYLLADSGTKVLVTTGKEVEKRGGINEKIVNGQVSMVDCQWGNNVGNRLACSEAVPATCNLHLSLAYIIYTSGTTGNPKGVMVLQINVIRLLINTAYIHFNNSDRILQTGALEFDASTFEIWGSLPNGLQLHLVGNEIILSAEMLKLTLQKNRITTIWLTAPLFNQLLEQDIQIFKELAYFLVGGDILSPPHINRLRNSYPYLKVINGYGPTENTTFSTTYLIDKDYQANIPIGRPLTHSTAYIVDKYNHLLPVGIPGELLVGGDGVARGYLNNPELTAEKFDHVLWDYRDYRDKKYKSFCGGTGGGFFKKSPLSVGDRIYKTGTPPAGGAYVSNTLYRTGDLAKWLPEGIIEFMGRLDQQTKIRGFRVELEEIEIRLLDYPIIKEAVVLVIKEESGDKQLCAYIVCNKKPDIIEIREFLGKKIPGYMVPSYFIPLDKIPLTPNGKIDRSALPTPKIKTSRKYVAPTNEVEGKLVEIWSEVLGRDSVQTSQLLSSLGIDDNFFELGGHSLKGTIMLSKLQREFNTRLSLAKLFQNPTVRKLSQYINKGQEERYIALAPVEEKEYYVLSSAQKRQYILSRMEFDSTVYNVPAIYKLVNEPDMKRLEKTFLRLIQRHESFRTSFIPVNNEPVQRIHLEVTFELEFYHLSTENTGESLATRSPQLATNTIMNFIRPFDLSQTPLLRVGVIKSSHSLNGGDVPVILMIDMPHIISDGISMGIFLKELKALYQGSRLTPLIIQYKDYARWKNEKIQQEKIKQQQDYWLKEFAGEIPVLNLPIDYSRPTVQSFAGNGLHFGLGKEETKLLYGLAGEQGATLFMVLTAVFNILLAKLCGQEDIVVGTPVAGRRHPDINNIIGMFVKTLALRNYPTGEKKFSDFLKEFKNSTLEAFDNEDYPFEDLIEKIAVSRDTSRNPLFDVMFVLQNLSSTVEIQKENPVETKLSLIPYGFAMKISKFDLSFFALETLEGLALYIEYCTTLFKHNTIERCVEYFKKIVSVITKKPGTRISEIEIISGKEKEEILYDFNNTGADYPKDKSIRELFAVQVEQTPDHIAVVGIYPIQEPQNEGTMEPDSLPNSALAKPVSISYRELNKKSAQLTLLLREKGVKSDTIMGLITERDIDMITCILGILKAGGAYLPIDPMNPAARIKYLLADSGAKVLLTTSEKLACSEKETATCHLHLSPVNDQLSLVNCQREGVVGNRLACSEDHLHLPPAPATSLAYIIYTSGSTGKPKGVAVTHADFSPLLHWGYTLGISPEDRVIQNLSYYFDWSVWEIFITLTSGAALYMITKQVLLNPEAEADFILRNGITTLHITPSQFQYLLNVGKKLKTLEYLFIGAEKLTLDLVGHSIELVPGHCRIFNMYGPTEATIISAVLEIRRSNYESFQELTSIPIGEPVANAALFILDKYYKLCPVNISGKLYIGGGLARGYLNNPELTAEKFFSISYKIHKSHMPHLSYLSEKFYKTDDHPAGVAYVSNTLYKTGDLAKWHSGGNVEFLGRIDFQVKIRGYRIELGEIESRLLAHRAVRFAAVIDWTSEKGEKYLCAYIVPEMPEIFDTPGDIASELRDFLSRGMPDYMIPSFYVKLEKIPLTPNGKTDRKALPKPGIISPVITTAPRNQVEKKLVDIWSEILGRDTLRGTQLQSAIGIDDNFFALGGHSLKATMMTVRIHKEFNVKLSLTDFFKNPVIRALAKRITATNQDKYISIQPVEKKEYYPLSPAQKRLYVLQMINPENINYNMLINLLLEGNAEKEIIESVFKELIKRHESLRTAFATLNDQPVQRIYNQVEFAIEYYDLNNNEKPTSNACCLTPESIMKKFIHPFDLSQAPLLRVGLIRIEHSRYILMLDMHHIISDGTSHGILMKEFTTFHRGETLPSLKLQSKDFSQWTDKRLNPVQLEKQADYWINRFKGELPGLKIPMDYPRPQNRNYSGNLAVFAIEPGEAQKLRTLANKENATMYIVIFTLFNILLSKLTLQEDIIIGSLAVGRKHPDLENIMGMFINTLAFRNYPQKDKKFIDFLREVKKNTLEAFDNEDYQFDDLVDKLKVAREIGRNPLFDVLFMFSSNNSQSTQQEKTTRRALKINPIKGALTRSNSICFLPAAIQEKTYFLRFNTVQNYLNTKPSKDISNILKKSLPPWKKMKLFY